MPRFHDQTELNARDLGEGFKQLYVGKCNSRNRLGSEGKLDDKDHHG